jgi:hypothetical protein
MTSPIINNKDFGFIITRHVNSEITNKYWNECIRYIRCFYLFKKIVIIDDNSDKKFLKAEFDYKNIEYITSEFHGRGELLPYYYFYKNDFFDNAIIIHDSVFIQQRINFEKLIDTKIKVLPLWHFSCEKKENYNNTARLIGSLSNNYLIMNVLFQNRDYDVLGKFNNDIWRGCFGVQCFINRDFLIGLENKYKLSNLLTIVKTRLDRCCLERIMGIVFFIEYLREMRIQSLLGDIKTYCKWGYSYLEHKENMRNKKIPRLSIVKVWSGR